MYLVTLFVTIELGNFNVCVLYEQGRGLHAKQFFETLLAKAKASLTSKHLSELESPDIANLLDFGQTQQLEFYIYKLNLFHTCKENKIKAYDFLKTLQFNLTQIEAFDEGDVIGKKFCLDSSRFLFSL